MSIREESGGLLGTSVTWEDIQKDCFDLFGPSAKLGDAKIVKDIAEGKGSMSRIGVIENPWQDANLAEENDWPKKFVVKIATALAREKNSQKEANMINDRLTTEEEDEKMARKIKEMHNNECNLYQKFAKVAGVKLLKAYIFHPFTEENPNRGYLLMEFVENAANLSSETYANEELMLEILQNLAKYHSLSNLFDENEKKAMSSGIIKEIFGMMLTPRFIFGSTLITAKFLEEDAEGFATRLRTFTLQLSTPEMCNKMDNLAEVLGMKRVLAHGDPWTCNMMFSQNDQGEIQLLKLIDLQTSYFGCIGHDLARVFTNLLTYKERNEKISYYLDKYFEFLTSFWDRHEEFPFTREQVVKAYKAYLPCQCYVVAVSTAFLSDRVCSESKDPEKMKKLLKEKTIGLIRSLEENFDNLMNA